jgi:hypothetical protein
METEKYEGILITTVASSLECLGQCFLTMVRGSARNVAIIFFLFNHN